MRAIKLTTMASALLIGFASLQAVAESKAAEIVDDSMITTKVKAKMIADKAVHALDISVETKEGVVNLSGEVKTDAEATAAVELAASTPGVKDVDTSNLKVSESKQPLSDVLVTAKVKGAFVREKLFGDKPTSVTGVKVETKEGVVYLTGTVRSEAEAKNAEKVAKSVTGVKKVESAISVKK